MAILHNANLNEKAVPVSRGERGGVVSATKLPFTSVAGAIIRCDRRPITPAA